MCSAYRIIFTIFDIGFFAILYDYGQVSTKYRP